MRSILLIATLLLSVGYSQGQIQVGATVGTQIPTGDLGDGAKTGYGFNIAGKYMVHENLAIGLNIGYSKFETELDGLSFTLIPVTGLFEYYFGSGKFSPYIGADAGLYNYGARISYMGMVESGSKNYFGFAPTGGILYGLSNKLSFCANLKYNYVLSEPSVATWLGINAGIIFKIN
jgi:hypothetical protein